MTTGSDSRPRDTVVELEFELGDADVFVAAASEAADCELRLEAIRQRSDGAVLEYLTVRGADPEQLVSLAADSPGIREARLLSVRDGTALLELISETAVATTLADAGSTFTSISATAGSSRVVAEVPPHVDASAVIDGFLGQYPSASLVARRETDRTAPTFTAEQFKDRLVDAMTDRQLQALRAAHAAGYYDWPRSTSTAAVAAELDVSAPTLAQHLRIAERKLLDALFEVDG